MNKRNPKSVIGLILVFLLGVGVGAGGFGLFLSQAEAPFYLLEKVMGDLPPDQVDAYVRAILQRNRSAAIDLWVLDDLTTDNAKNNALRERRETITAELLQYAIQSEYSILRTEWWTTCCEPGVTCDSRSAGGARLYVQFLNAQGAPVQYIFDVFTREQPYWGAAQGYPPRRWVIRDVYLREQAPLYWPMVSNSNVRFVEQQDFKDSYEHK